MQSIRKYRATILFILDMLIIATAYLLSGFLIESNKSLFTFEYKKTIANTIFFHIIINQIIFCKFNIYKNITRYENGKDYIIYILLAIFSGAIVFFTDILSNVQLVGFKQIILATILILTAIVSYRVVIRFMLTRNSSENENSQNKKNLLIIGAGEARKRNYKNIKNYNERLI